ncbi:MAG: glycosyltransferase family 2 protein [Bacteroidia bacterium]|nr:glycosyltransferase family 2 protein [Bacteroidia bacterium]
MKLTVAIITYNESQNIKRCIQSVKSIADDIIVIDSFSTDNTVELANELGARVVLQQFLGHIEQKNFAISQSLFPFVLSLDADEAIDETLVNEILKIKELINPADGYITNRYNNYCGKWINHGAWQSDLKLRLWNSQKGKWGGLNPHDKFEMQAGSNIEKLKGKILHWSYHSITEHEGKVEYFSTIAAKAYQLKGKKSSYFKIWFSPVFRFVRDYILNLGFLDGKFGFIIAKLTAKEVYLKYKKLMQLEK